MLEVVGFLLGSVLGSFGLVLAERSLKNQSFGGRSKCGYCKHTLSAIDLFPIFSYIFLRGKCRYCKKKIGIEYVIVEIAMGLIIGFLFLEKFSPDLIFKTFFITILVALFITDIKKMFIPDRITYPAIVISLAYLILVTIYKVGYLFHYLSQSRVGQLLLPPHTDYFQRHALITAYPLLSGLAMAVLIGGFFTFLIYITKGKGMGGGDVKLGALMGLVLGFPNALVALMTAFISGAIFSLGLIALRKKHFGQSIPFGPFLVFGSLVALFWGNEIIEWYLRLSM